MIWLAPIAAPVALVAAAHAWIIPELYAARGASVARPKGPRNEHAETVAQGLLGDLLATASASCSARPAWRSSAGELGTWLVGEAGALLLTNGGRRVHASACSATEADLPPSDRDRPPAAGAAGRRGGLRHRRQPRVRRRALAGAPPAARAHAPGHRRRSRRRRRASLGRWAYDVVIAGGGFGGLYAARRLERRLPRHSARIMLVSDVNFLLYTPLLPGAAAGSLEPRHVVVPLREELEWADIRLGRVTGADPARNEVHVTTVDGRHETLRYDQLIVTPGSVSRVLPVPGLAEHGLGFKTLADAIAVRNRALLNLEIAESLPDDEARRGYLTFVFVGAGYAGLEGIAELQDYMADVIDRYPRCRIVGTRFVLVEARDRVMPEIPASLAEFATRELRGRGMEIRTGTSSSSADAGAVTLSTGERIPTRLLCWTAGVMPAPVVRELGLPLDPTGPHRGGRHHAGRGQLERLGDRRRRRRARPRPAPARAEPADLPARDPPGPAGRGERGRDAGRPPAAAVPLPHARRVRRHGPAQGGRDHPRRAPARLPGLVRGPQLPPGDDAGRRPPGRGSPSTGPWAWSSGAPPPSSASSATRPPARGARCGERRSPSARGAPATCAPRSSWARRRWTLAQGARPAAAASTSAPRTTWTPAGSASAALLEFIVAQADGSLRDLRGRRPDGRLHARRPLRRDGRADRAVGRAVARRPGGGAGAARALLARVAHARASAAWCSASAGRRT